MQSLKDMPVMILCGGKGTRLRDVTELLPKPMVPIGEQPIVWHIMKCYAAFGVRRFILCLGYKKEAFVDYFMNYHARTADFTIRLSHDPQITFHNESRESEWEVTLAGTGLETMTGGRVLQASRYLKEEDEEFFLTYGDGVADIDLEALLKTHREAGRMMTITGVHPEARFGALKIRDGLIRGFDEKPTQGEGRINGGFMVLRKEFVSRYLAGRKTDFYLEQAPMREAAEEGNMAVYRHNGFWQCMDNQREFIRLNQFWDKGHAPWTTFWN